jgi:fucokinase
MGGGLDIRTDVNVPMGSGLGTSSILAATTLSVLSEMVGDRLGDQLSDRTMRLEQLMTTGGGWQDQAGGIFPGAKLVSTGPGMRQRLRVQPVAWDHRREEELQGLMILYYTGIRRIAKGLLQQVVGRYLARETAAVQVLHSIKTLAMEMSYAMQEGDWDYLGSLLDRHWELNQILDPNTTNAPINSLLALVRPYIRGAKLAGAGGGGFMMLLARSREAASELRRILADRSLVEGGAVHDWSIARQGLRIET